ncbi:MAG: aspartate carbamoyltransferase regulatory subunit [Candidatus Woesearchaeota archaeon]
MNQIEQDIFNNKIDNDNNESLGTVYTEYKQMKLGKIENGTVIDHIPPELCFKIITILKLEDYGKVVSAAVNLNSLKRGKKGIIKISSKYLTEEEINKISVVCQDVTACIIKDYKVEEKIRLRLPMGIKNIVRCNNPNCITNVEDVNTHFKVINQIPLKIRCNFCERIINKKDIVLK